MRSPGITYFESKENYNHRCAINYNMLGEHSIQCVWNVDIVGTVNLSHTFVT